MTYLRVVGTAAAALLIIPMAACGEGVDRAEADQAQPTVLESATDSAEVGEVEPSPEGGEDDIDHDAPEEAEPTPVPASSEGPAQNWPAPEPPEEIYTPTEEGAEALLQYWFDARHYARITGDTGPLENVSHEDCALCRSHLDRLKEVFQHNGWFVSEQDQVIDRYVRMEDEVTATGLLALEEADFQAYWEGEIHAETEVAEVDAFGFALQFQDEHWVMAELNYIDEYDSSRLGAAPVPEILELGLTFSMHILMGGLQESLGNE